MQQRFDIPPELGAWAAIHGHVIEHVNDAIRAAEVPMTEKQMWNLIARTYSPTWAAANDRLQTAEQKVRIFKSPENRPLGAIGNALEGDAVNEIKAEQLTSLALFTIEDEELRQEHNLKVLLAAAMKTQHALADSIRISREALELTASFGQAAPRPQAPEKSAAHQKLQGVFGSFARQLFSRRPAETPLQQQKL